MRKGQPVCYAMEKKRVANSRADVEQETEVDVDDVSLAVDHNVSVVTVLDLEDVAGDGVGGHGLDEVHARLLKWDCVDTTVLVDEEAEEVVDLGSAHLISRCSVGNDVDDSALWEGGKDRAKGQSAGVAAQTVG